MGFLGIDQTTDKRTYVTNQTAQGVDLGGVGIFALGNNQNTKFNLSLYDVDKNAPTINLQSGSPGATAAAALPTVGGLSWQVWLVIAAAVYFLFWSRRH